MEIIQNLSVASLASLTATDELDLDVSLPVRLLADAVAKYQVFLPISPVLSFGLYEKF